jgi:hypothetical protein
VESLLLWKRNKYYILVCVRVGLVIQNVKRRGLMSSVACLTPPHFSPLSHKEYDFQKKKKKVIEHKMCFDFFYDLCPKHLILIVIRRDIFTNAHVSSRKVSVILARFSRNFNFRDIFYRESQMSSVVKIRPTGAQLFHAKGGRTDMTKLTVAFHNFANAHKKTLKAQGKNNTRG